MLLILFEFKTISILISWIDRQLYRWEAKRRKGSAIRYRSIRYNRIHKIINWNPFIFEVRGVRKRIESLRRYWCQEA